MVSNGARMMPNDLTWPQDGALDVQNVGQGGPKRALWELKGSQRRPKGSPKGAHGMQNSSKIDPKFETEFRAFRGGLKTPIWEGQSGLCSACARDSSMSEPTGTRAN